MFTLPADMNLVWIGVAIGIIALIGLYFCRSKLPSIPGLSSLMALQPEQSTSTEGLSTEGLINKEHKRKKSQKDDELSSDDEDEN